jgi:hypothetical protein
VVLAGADSFSEGTSFKYSERQLTVTKAGKCPVFRLDTPGHPKAYGAAIDLSSVVADANGQLLWHTVTTTVQNGKPVQWEAVLENGWVEGYRIVNTDIAGLQGQQIAIPSAGSGPFLGTVDGNRITGSQTILPALADRLFVVVNRLRTRPAGCATASANRLLTWHDPQPRTPSSELVTLNSKRRCGSGGSDDDARRDQLKLDVPVKQDGPVDGQVELLSDRQRPVGSEAQTGAAHVDSATGPVLIRPTTARDAVPNFQVQRKADTGAALRTGSLR